MSLDFVFQRQPWDATVELWLRQRHQHGAALGEITMKEVKVGALNEPTLRLTEEEAQKMIDALWSAGFKPSDGHGSVGQLAATEKHLRDMRELVFRQLGPGMEPPA